MMMIMRMNMRVCMQTGYLRICVPGGTSLRMEWKTWRSNIQILSCFVTSWKACDRRKSPTWKPSVRLFVALFNLLLVERPVFHGSTPIPFSLIMRKTDFTKMTWVEFCLLTDYQISHLLYKKSFDHHKYLRPSKKSFFAFWYWCAYIYIV